MKRRKRRRGKRNENFLNFYTSHDLGWFGLVWDSSFNFTHPFHSPFHFYSFERLDGTSIYSEGILERIALLQYACTYLCRYVCMYVCMITVKI